MMESGKSLARVGAVLVVVSAAIAAALVGGASTGRAATTITLNLEPLIATSSEIENQIPQVSYGGKIGYHLEIKNTDTSTTPQVSITVTSPNATYLDSVATFNDAPTTCDAQSGSNGHVMVCTVPGGTLKPDDTLKADFRFQATTLTSVTQVVTTAAISVAAKTVGGKNNNGTTLASEGVNTALVAGGDKEDTYLRKNEKAGTGNLSLPDHPQNFSVTEPPTLLGDPFGIAVSMHDSVGAPPQCIANSATECFGAKTQLTIPAASSILLGGNPFYNGTTFNPYSWAMNAQYPQGSSFKLHGVYHIVDGSHAFQQLLKCDDPLVGGAPSVAYPICYDTLDQITNKRMLIATGRGLENGGLGWN
jgi:hypothetical protein